MSYGSAIIQGEVQNQEGAIGENRSHCGWLALPPWDFTSPVRANGPCPERAVEGDLTVIGDARHVQNVPGQIQAGGGNLDRWLLSIAVSDTCSFAHCDVGSGAVHPTCSFHCWWSMEPPPRWYFPDFSNVTFCASLTSALIAASPWSVERTRRSALGKPLAPAAEPALRPAGRSSLGCLRTSTAPVANGRSGPFKAPRRNVGKRQIAALEMQLRNPDLIHASTTGSLLSVLWAGKKPL